MQRLFSTFANGWPGTGLLNQRLLIGYRFPSLWRRPTGANTSRCNIRSLSYIEAIAGILLILGLGTPVTGALAALTEVWSIFWHRGDLWIAIILATFATSLSMIGLGAWSIDADLFGRKRMKIQSARFTFPPEVVVLVATSRRDAERRSPIPVLVPVTTAIATLLLWALPS